jgi:predicted ester cyclase
VIDAGDTVVAEFVLRGRQTGPLVAPAGTIPPTNKMIELPSIGVYELRDGKLAASRGEFDRMTLLVQLGLMPAPIPVR